MKSNLEIMLVEDKFALIDGHDSIVKGCKVIHVRNYHIEKALTLVMENVDGKKIETDTLGYIGHGGASFLYFRPEVHRRFIKYITKKDLIKLL